MVGVIADALHTLVTAPALALIFGSIVRGEENARSDVDLLLIANCTFGDVVKVLHPVQEQLHREINLVLYTAAEFISRIADKDAFIGKILANPKLFVIGTEHDLGKLAGHSSLEGV